MNRSARYIARMSVKGGLVAGIAMMPFGAVLRALGHQVNVYGELVVRSVLGHTPMLAQLVFHIAVSITLAIPFVLVARWRGSASVVAGGLYGMLSWAVLNATLLPLWFERPTGWVLGFGVTWPSVLVHVVYGAVLGVVLARGVASNALGHLARTS